MHDADFDFSILWALKAAKYKQQRATSK